VTAVRTIDESSFEQKLSRVKENLDRKEAKERERERARGREDVQAFQSFGQSIRTAFSGSI
jgi:hypothetical protein